MSEPAGGKLVGLCADDFALAPPIGDAVVALAQCGRISATSCITTAAGWPTQARRLDGLDIEIGLHLNLTEGEPLSAELRRIWPRFPSLPRLLLAAAIGRLPADAIAAEWQAQWDRFVQATGRPPRFVDGHLHVHQVSGVRERVLETVRARSSDAIAVRNTGTLAGPAAALKRRVIRATGGIALQSALRRADIPHNTVLLGAYDFHEPDYRSLMRAWLTAAPQRGGLIFCHPALQARRDAVADARVREATYLGSDAFAEDLDAAAVKLGPAWVRSSSAG